jgi:hypothetical protein
MYIDVCMISIQHKINYMFTKRTSFSKSSNMKMINCSHVIYIPNQGSAIIAKKKDTKYPSIGENIVQV